MDNDRKRRRRDTDGRYLSDQTPTDEYLRLKATRKERTRQNQAMGLRLFNEYLDAVFLRGEENDWIMADSQTGPLASIPTQLMKMSCLPSTKERCERARKRYFDFSMNTKQGNIKQEYVLDGNNLDGKQKRRRIFKRRRFPKLGSDEEMELLWKWIDSGLECKAFKVRTRDEAYEIIRKELNTYKEYKRQRYYTGYPPVLSENYGNQILDLTRTPDEQQEEGSASVPESQSRGAPLNQNCRNSTGLPQDLSSYEEEEEQAYVSTVCHLFKIAKNDRLFFLFCKIDEDMRDCRLNCMATVLLLMHTKGEIKCNSVMLDALQYARLRSSGVRDSSAYRVQQNRVHVNAEMLKIVRNMYTNLRVYEQMHWNDFPFQTARDGQAMRSNL